jgi:hypothetical protein
MSKCQKLAAFCILYMAGKCLNELATLQVEEGAWVHMEHELGGVR